MLHIFLYLYLENVEDWPDMKVRWCLPTSCIEASLANSWSGCHFPARCPCCLSVQQQLGWNDLNPTAVPALTTEVPSCHKDFNWAQLQVGLAWLTHLHEVFQVGDTTHTSVKWTLSKWFLPSFCPTMVKVSALRSFPGGLSPDRELTNKERWK